MAIVTSITENDIGEVTAVKAKKGSTGELVVRHVESVIPLLSRLEYNGSNDEPECSVPPSQNELSPSIICDKESSNPSAAPRNNSRPVRQASVRAAQKIEQQIAQGDV